MPRSLPVGGASSNLAEGAEPSGGDAAWSPSNSPARSDGGPQQQGAPSQELFGKTSDYGFADLSYQRPPLFPAG